MSFVHFPKVGDYLLEPELVGGAPKPEDSSAYLAEHDKESAQETPSNLCQNRHGAQHKLPEHIKSTTRGEDPTNQTTSHKSACLSQAGNKSYLSSGQPNKTGHTSSLCVSPFFERYEYLLPLLGSDWIDMSERDTEPTSSQGSNLTKNAAVRNKPTERRPRVQGVGQTTAQTKLAGANTRNTARRTESNYVHVSRNKRDREDGHVSGNKRMNDQNVRVSENQTNSSTDVVDGSKVFNAKLKSGKVKQRFKRSAWAVVNVLKLTKVIIKRTDSSSALLKTFTDMSCDQETEHSENMKNYGLDFDPSYFRAKKEVSMDQTSSIHDNVFY